jgi:hypothetical protein
MASRISGDSSLEFSPLASSSSPSLQSSSSAPSSSPSLSSAQGLTCSLNAAQSPPPLPPPTYQDDIDIIFKSIYCAVAILFSTSALAPLIPPPLVSTVVRIRRMQDSLGVRRIVSLLSLVWLVIFIVELTVLIARATGALAPHTLPFFVTFVSVVGLVLSFFLTVAVPWLQSLKFRNIPQISETRRGGVEYEALFRAHLSLYYFQTFLKREFCAENLYFVAECDCFLSKDLRESR